ncbi:TspO/MBR family protein [Nocardioides mangrovi]|uniref:Tryptophan-rich sensory protein n=1 Tax=Nocardioides mangrovi TaxID=2874580 RepID=A0ABS7UHC0_9ACTN|nr:TspO/MBR family protein [Nocardioides mangrovi]MBZ5740272.1 tryptophan-rich sensory protein [Nocardioides mangrovi]
MSTHALPARRGLPSGLALVVFLLAVAAVAGVGGLAAANASDTYDRLELPAFAPPSWLFGPVWTVLYVLIAVAGWLVWRQVGVDRAMAAYAVQLVLNACWTPLFFAGDWYGAALVEIVVLVAAVVVTIGMFWRRQRAAAYLLLPYAAWVGFATALNASIWWLNR